MPVGLQMWMIVLVVFASAGPAMAESDGVSHFIGYTRLMTNLPGGRHANVRTMRAVISKIDGTDARPIADPLADDPDAWTQFAGWSPDGKQAIVARGWQDPENARWEEEHGTFRFDAGRRLLDSYLTDVSTGEPFNVTAVERVSDYNAGLFFLKGGRQLGFTAMIHGVSKPYMMDLDGRNKHDVSNESAGFAYGYSASPDGTLISYHEDYQVYIANSDGSNKQHVTTGNSFNFVPTWSPDGQWLLFLSGEQSRCNPYIVRRDGTGLRQIADRRGYEGWILFLDVDDFHQGSSDVPVWSADGKSIYFTAKIGKCVELCVVTLDEQVTQLTDSPDGTLHYHPTPSPDGTELVYGSKRSGVRQLFAMRVADRFERQITNLVAGQGAMWAHWRPIDTLTK